MRGKIQAYPKIVVAARLTFSNSGLSLYSELPLSVMKLERFPQMAVLKTRVTQIQNGPYMSGPDRLLDRRTPSMKLKFCFGMQLVRIRLSTVSVSTSNKFW